MGYRRLGLGIVLLAAPFMVLSGCGDGPAEPAVGVGGSGGGGPGGGQVGDACSKVNVCRKGLECVNGVCELGHSIGQGEACTLSGECKDGLQCILGACQPAGTGETGDSCVGDGDCKSGYKCLLVGFSTQCAPEGDGDLGDDCKSSADCYGGLTCTLGKCAKPVPGAPSFGVSAWQGVACDQQSPNDVRAFFEVPGVQNPKGQEGDFFRLPFPNDARIVNGKVNLDGFPTPGTDLLGFDPVKIYVDELANETGWGTSPTVYFRFSGGIDFDTFSTEVAGKYPLQWVDITPNTPEYGSSSGLSWLYSPSKTHYVCDDFIAIRRSIGAPMLPGHAYAVYLSMAGKDAAGNPIKRSEHLTALLGDNAPADPVLAKAHTAYKPFRDYMKAKLIDPSTVLNATVITVGKVRDPMTTLAGKVAALAAPTAKSWVKCATGVKSPCPQAEAERACGDGSAADYDEYHALVTLPIFQKGTAPYADTGGGVRLDQPERSEDVCLAITVPKAGTMPAAGWPLAVYAHGTGGSFRSHVRAEIAGALAKSGLAVIGIDQVQHGPRRGSSTASPNDLFFNFKNPAAARGNPIQGAVDQLGLARLVASLDLPATTTGGAAIKIDPDGIVFYGHSQGSTHGSLALPYLETYKAAVLSGNGASLIHALLSKTEPVNIAGAVPWVLADVDSDGNLNLGDMSPPLSILQFWIDPADPLNHALAIGRQPETGHLPKHVFQTYGIGDRFSPAPTLQSFAIAAGLELAKADSSVTKPDVIEGLTEQNVPIAGNVDVGGSPITLVVRQYAPASGSDGHFVATDVAAANTDVTTFLSMAATGQVPAVGK